MEAVKCITRAVQVYGLLLLPFVGAEARSSSNGEVICVRMLSQPPFTTCTSSVPLGAPSTPRPSGVKGQNTQHSILASLEAGIWSPEFYAIKEEPLQLIRDNGFQVKLEIRHKALRVAVSMKGQLIESAVLPVGQQ